MYVPKPFLGSLRDINIWLQDILEQFRLYMISGNEKIYMLGTSYVEPEKPRDGMIVYADGTEWDPGSGEGFYGYYNADWHSLG